MATMEVLDFESIENSGQVISIELDIDDSTDDRLVHGRQRPSTIAYEHIQVEGQKEAELHQLYSNWAIESD